MTARDADFNFREYYGKDVKSTGIKVDYNSLIPGFIKDNMFELEKIANTKDLLVDVKSKQFIEDEINDLISSYIAIKDSCPHKYISKNMSNLVLCVPQIYDQTMCNFITPYLLSEDNSELMISSRFTKVIYDVFTSEFKKEFEELTSSLINTVIEYFDPEVVSKLLYLIIRKYKNTNADFFTKERIRGYYEALINRENVIYSNKYIKLNESVGYYYFIATYTEVKDILTDYYGVYELIKMGTNLVYGEEFKLAITDYLLKAIFARSENNEFITTLRYIETEIEKWVKHKKLEERPEMVELFKYIDMNYFVSSLYVSGIHILGNTDEIMRNFDTDIEKLDEDIFKGNIKPENIENSKMKLESLKKRRLDYIRTKSAISLLFVEIMSNEKIVYQIFDEELVLRIALLEPYFDFAMNDVNSNVINSFFKRNFRPLLNSCSINPYYIHFKEQELSSDEAKYIATVLSTLIHPNMRSIESVAGILNFENFELAQKALKYNYIDSLEIHNHIILSMKDRIKGFLSQEKSSIPEEIFSKLESIDNIQDFSELKKLVKDQLYCDNTKECEYNSALQKSYSALNTIVDTDNWINSCKETMLRVIKRMNEIISNIISENSINSGRISYNENKPVLNFWPLTQSYDYAISEFNNAEKFATQISTSESFEEMNVTPDGCIDKLEVGDIIHQRYRNRYSATDPDK